MAAEALLRDGLRIRLLSPQLIANRRRIFPEDDWSVGATKSLLGASIIALVRDSQAETVSLEARRNLAALSRPSPRDVHDTTVRLIDLYVASGKHDEAAHYRALLRSSP